MTSRESNAPRQAATGTADRGEAANGVPHATAAPHATSKSHSATVPHPAGPHPAGPAHPPAHAGSTAPHAGAAQQHPGATAPHLGAAPHAGGSHSPGPRGSTASRTAPGGGHGAGSKAAQRRRNAKKRAATAGSRGAGNVPERARRRNDAQASRAALVEAASDLFDARGYEGATIRDIGERAGVDTALIARYFGGKEGLYLAALAREPGPVAGGDPDSVVAGLLTGNARRRHGPMTLAMVSPTLTDSLRDQVRPLIERNLTVPLTEWLRRAGAPDPELRAELLVGVAVGISLTRAGGTLPALSAAGPEEIRALLDPLIDEVGRPADTA